MNRQGVIQWGALGCWTAVAIAAAWLPTLRADGAAFTWSALIVDGVHFEQAVGLATWIGLATAGVGYAVGLRWPMHRREMRAVSFLGAMAALWAAAVLVGFVFARAVEPGPADLAIGEGLGLAVLAAAIAMVVVAMEFKRPSSLPERLGLFAAATLLISTALPLAFSGTSVLDRMTLAIVAAGPARAAVWLTGISDVSLAMAVMVGAWSRTTVRPSNAQSIAVLGFLLCAFVGTVGCAVFLASLGATPLPAAGLLLAVIISASARHITPLLPRIRGSQGSRLPPGEP